MSTGRTKPPSYRHHKASGQAVVTLSGQDFYLGPYGTKVSRNEYDRRVGEWMAAGRTLPKDDNAAPITVVEMVNGFRRSNVAPPSKSDEYMTVMAMVVRLYGRTPAIEFGPLALKVVREQMVAAGWKRRTVNQRLHYVRRIVRWGVEHQIVPADNLVALRAVEPLRKGHTTAPESDEIQPVAIEHVEASIATAPPTLAGMVRLQLHTGMRAGELCAMRTGEIDTADPTCWVYRPADHKNAHRGKSREVAIGPKAIDVLRPFLRTDLAAFIFSPATAEAERRAKMSAERKTPKNQGNKVGTNRKRRPEKQPGERYDTNSYRRAVEYVTRRAFPPPPTLARKWGETRKQWQTRLGPKEWARLLQHVKAHHWSTHQLRHAFGTHVINAFTAEHAQRALGHSSMKATAIYAKLSLEKAKEVARAIG